MNCVILGSGKGTNARAILEAWSNNQLGNADIKAVFSENKGATILKIADSFAVPSRAIEMNCKSPFISSEHVQTLIKNINEFSPDLIILAGFMKILPSEFISEYKESIINIHPSLLPSFKGKSAIKRAFDHGVKITGCTVHWVTEKVDEGKIIAQAPVRVMETDTLENLSMKIQAAEHVLLPTVISNLSLGNS
ncbi:MAG: phosphoribosylglycinamide formyltransferase [Verrucomicrobiota bacterium]|nr:phosphoribosylglycinamide formyltransferase [Verrucomicrobiota bacterium]